MPITVHEPEAELYRDPEHWLHVMEMLFVPAVEKAGFTPVKPSAEGTSMIHSRIIGHLVKADIVLCDLSQHNPNVLFELGVRTSINKPVALVKDEHLKLPFDIQGLNTYHYRSGLAAWDLGDEIEKLAEHIRTSASESSGENPLWRHFGVGIVASAPDVDRTPEEAQLEILLEKVDTLSREIRRPIGEPVYVTEDHGGSTATWRSSKMSPVEKLIRDVKGVLTVYSFTSVGGVTFAHVRTVVTKPEAQASRAIFIIGRLASNGYPAEIEETTPETISIRVTKEPSVE